MTASPTPRRAAGARCCFPSLNLAGLGDQAFLGLVLRPVSRGGADALAARLLDAHGDLAGVCAAARLGDVQGVSPAAVLSLRLLQAAAERLSRPSRLDRPEVSSFTALVAYARTAHAGLAREQVRVLFLDNRNHLMRDEMLTEGTVDHAPLYPREVMRRALQLSASALILIHNHPSGDPTPSRADIELTRQVVDGARALGLAVHDHLVVARGGVASFRQLGLM